MRKLTDEEVSRVLSQAEGPGVGYLSYLESGRDNACGCFTEVAFQANVADVEGYEFGSFEDMADSAISRVVGNGDVRDAEAALDVLRRAGLVRGV